MSKTLTFELPDEAVEALTQISAKTGEPFERLALDWLRKYKVFPSPPMSAETRRTEMANFLKFAGSANADARTGVDNEQIDAELARESGRGLSEP